MFNLVDEYRNSITELRKNFNNFFLSLKPVRFIYAIIFLCRWISCLSLYISSLIKNR